MSIVAFVRSVWSTLARRARAEQSLEDEVRAYVDLLADEYRRAGLSPEEARRRALVDTGGVEQVKEATRDAWLGSGIANAWRELRFTLRGLRNAPVFTLVAVAILAIGVGGATAIFTVIKGSLLQPLPAVVRPSELVSIEPTRGTTTLYDFSYLDYLDDRGDSRTLAGLAGYDGTSMTLEDRWGPRRSTWISYVTGNFFSVLGAAPAAGRLLEPSDETSAAPAVVLAYDLWQSRYGGDTSVVGATIDLAGHPMTVVGIAPPHFIGAMLMHPMEVWIPVTTLQTLVEAPGLRDDRASRNLRLVGRLAPGRTAAEAQHEFSLIAARLAKTYSADEGLGAKVFAGAGMTDEERTALAKMPRLLAVAVAVLLLIACANVANLSLVRAAARRRELATRLALGASRRSLVLRMVLEGSVLAAAGGLAGVIVAQLLVRTQAIAGTIAGMPERVGLDVSLDGRVLAVALGVSALTALVVSVAPALHVIHLPPGAVLKDGAAGALRRHSVGQRALVAAQIAASLVLLASAAMVDDGFRRVLARDPGFDAAGVTVAGADLWQAQLTPEQITAYRRAWMARAAAEPSIAAVAVAQTVPPAPWDRPQWIFHGGLQPSVPPRRGDTPAGGMRVYVDAVSPGFFDVLHLPITLGRGFLESDDEHSAGVVIVSRRFAERAWPHENPLGKTLSLPATRRPPMRVVGVAADVRFTSIFDEAAPVAYVPIAQHAGTGVNFVLRSRDGGAVPDRIIRHIGAEVDARVPMSTNNVTDEIDGELRPHRVASAWIGVFGAIALLLAAIGLYGVVAQGVLHRARELAVRSALGATPRGLVSLVIGEGLRVATVGAVVGVLAGAATMRVIESQFEGVSIVDARAAVVALAVLAAAMLAACWIPAQRAGRLDPAGVLRSE